MFRWIRAWIYKLTGFFGDKADEMQADRHVMAATYDNSIESKIKRFDTVKSAVAELMGIEEQKITTLNELNKRVAKYEQVKAGARNMLQKLINRLRQENPSITEAEIKRHPEYLKHSSAFADADRSQKEVEERIAEVESDLEARRGQIATYKTELQGMQRSIKKLKEEKHEAIADVQIAKHAEAVDNVLNGLSRDTTDQDLEAARAARARAKNRAKISASLAGNDAEAQESEYLQYAADTEATSKLDGLLDFGETDKSSKDAALLPE